MHACTEPDIKRTAYLHEAGHVIVALAHNLIFKQVVCDGEVGHCDARYPDDICQELEKKYGQQPITTMLLRSYASDHFGVLSTLVGGIAGESVVLGRPIYSTRRASDDLSSFFGYLAIMSRGLKGHEFDPIWRETFQNAQDDAWQIVSRRQVDVEKLADALESASQLSCDEVRALLNV